MYLRNFLANIYYIEIIFEKFVYRPSRTLEEYNKEHQTISLVMYVLKNILFLVFALVLDCKYNLYIKFSKTIEVIAMSVGYTGVLLGLYYSNFNTLITNSYKEAPTEVLKMLNTLSFSAKTKRLLISNIVSMSILTLEHIINSSYKDAKIGLLTGIIIIINIISITFNYNKTSDKLIEYNKQFKLSDDILDFISKIITNLPSGYVDEEDSKNKIYQKEQEKIKKYFLSLKTLNQYNLKINKNNQTFVEQIIQMIDVILIYSIYKNKIQYNSKWFPLKEKYSKFYDIDFVEYDIANKTGMLPLNKKEPDKHWLENRLMDIVNDMYLKILSENDFNNIILYLHAVHKTIPSYLYNDVAEVIFDCIKKQFDDFVNEISNITEGNEKICTIFDMFLVVLENVALSLRLMPMDSDYVSTIEGSINIFKCQSKGELNCFINNQECRNLFFSCKVERKNESRIVTPDKYFVDIMILKVYNYLEDVKRIVAEIYDYMLKIAENEKSEKRFNNAIFAYYECMNFVNRLNNIDGIIEQKVNEVNEHYPNKLNFESKYKLTDLMKNNYGNLLKNFGNVLIEYLTMCREGEVIDIPDFYGYFINESNKYLFYCIMENRINDFAKIYEEHIHKVLFYQESIRREVTSKDYASVFVVKSITEPFIHYCEISSMAMIYGILTKDDNWVNLVNSEFEKLMSSEIITEKLAFLVSCVSAYRDLRLYHSRSFDIISAFRDVVYKEIESYTKENGVYAPRYDTQDSLLNKYLNNKYTTFLGFEDIEEFYIIKLINQKLSNDKKYKSQSGWEEYEDT